MDEHNTKLVASVHPTDRPNPEPKPTYDLVVMGAGVAGLLSVIIGKALGKRCCMIEQHYMGGDCLNIGCFPSKALLASSRRMHEVKTAASLGVIVEGEGVVAQMVCSDMVLQCELTFRKLWSEFGSFVPRSRPMTVSTDTAGISARISSWVKPNLPARRPLKLMARS